MYIATVKNQLFVNLSLIMNSITYLYKTLDFWVMGTFGGRQSFGTLSCL